MLHFIIASLFLSSSIKCENILMISSLMCYSHDLMHATIADKLAENGHNVTLFLQYDVYDGKSCNSNINLFFMKGDPQDFRFLYGDRNPRCSKYMVNAIIMSIRMNEDQIKHPEIQRIIQERESFKFDLIILECCFCGLLQLGIIFNCPVIQYQAPELPNYFYDTHMGNYLNAAVHKLTGFIGTRDVPLTFPERIKSLLEGLFFSHIMEYFLKYINSKSLMENCPKYFNISLWNKFPTKPQMAVLTTKVITDLGQVRPLSPNKIIKFGYSHIKEPKSLPNGKIKDFIDQSTKDVILVSFGSNIKFDHLQTNLIKVFINTFRQLTQYNFIWNTEIKRSEEISENVLTSKWLPIADILANSKIKLFITHGGLRSLEEGIYRQIPMLIIPVFADQFSNAGQMVDNRIAEQLDLNLLKESSLIEGITNMMENYDFYKENLRELNERVFDEIMSSLDDAAWKIESHMKFKNFSEFFETFEVPFYQRYFLDIYIFLALSAFISNKIFYFLKIKIFCSVCNYLQRIRN